MSEIKIKKEFDIYNFEDFKYITFTGPMAHVYRKYVTTEFNHAKALAVIELFEYVDVIDTKEKSKLIIMLNVLHENQDQIERVEEKDKMRGTKSLYKKLTNNSFAT